MDGSPQQTTCHAVVSTWPLVNTKLHGQWDFSCCCFSGSRLPNYKRKGILNRTGLSHSRIIPETWHLPQPYPLAIPGRGVLYVALV